MIYFLFEKKKLFRGKHFFGFYKLLDKGVAKAQSVLNRLVLLCISLSILILSKRINSFFCVVKDSINDLH